MQTGGRLLRKCVNKYCVCYGEQIFKSNNYNISWYPSSPNYQFSIKDLFFCPRLYSLSIFFVNIDSSPLNNQLDSLTLLEILYKITYIFKGMVALLDWCLQSNLTLTNSVQVAYLRVLILDQMFLSVSSSRRAGLTSLKPNSTTKEKRKTIFNLY